MSSETIYHYTYLIVNIENGMKYIGVHSCNCLPEKDIGVKYFSSSTDLEFLKEQKEYPARFTYEVIMIWNTRREAMLHERFLLLTPNAARSPVYYNLHNGGPHLDASGRVVVKDKNGKTMQVSVNDPRYISGDLIHVAKGQVVVKDKDGNTTVVSITDPRYISGELIHVMKGKTSVKDKDGNTTVVSITDPRYISGELVGHTTGKVPVKDKDEKTFMVSKTDPRYLSGELVPVSKGKTHVKDKDGNSLYVSVNDPRFISGELVGYHKGVVRSAETRKKMSKANKGSKNPNYGKTHSDATRQKISNTHKGKIVTAETRMKKSKAMKEYWKNRKLLSSD